jgi:hypothetical protein
MCVHLSHTGGQDSAKATTTLTSNSNQRQEHPIFLLYVFVHQKNGAGSARLPPAAVWWLDCHATCVGMQQSACPQHTCSSTRPSAFIRMQIHIFRAPLSSSHELFLFYSFFRRGSVIVNAQLQIRQMHCLSISFPRCRKRMHNNRKCDDCRCPKAQESTSANCAH